LPEDGVVAVDVRRLTQINVELAGRYVRLFAVARADRACFVRGLRVEFGLKPVANAAVARLPCPEWTACFDIFNPRVRSAGNLLVDRAVEYQAVVVARARQGNKASDMVGRQLREKHDFNLPQFGIQSRAIDQPLAARAHKPDRVPKTHDLGVELAD